MRPREREVTGADRVTDERGGGATHTQRDHERQARRREDDMMSREFRCREPRCERGREREHSDLEEHVHRARKTQSDDGRHESPVNAEWHRGEEPKLSAVIVAGSKPHGWT